MPSFISQQTIKARTHMTGTRLKGITKFVQKQIKVRGNSSYVVRDISDENDADILLEEDEGITWRATN